jgi:hypothetical protein
VSVAEVDQAAAGGEAQRKERPLPRTASPIAHGDRCFDSRDDFFGNHQQTSSIGHANEDREREKERLPETVDYGTR